jgi:3-deoxy-D-manno-octulosonate 8-phosphate phosphatase (KDO 8-P phosphatase)
MKRKDLKPIAKRIKLFLMDVDGVLTDGRLYYTEMGEEIKVFDVRDGLGIKLLQRSGIEVGVISGRSSKALLKRLEELGIEEVHTGRNDKLEVLEKILKEKNLKAEEVAYVGDDYLDVPVLKVVGFSCYCKGCTALGKKACPLCIKKGRR